MPARARPARGVSPCPSRPSPWCPRPIARRRPRRPAGSPGAEVHPEVSFRALDARVTDRKASGPGRAHRFRALQQVMEVEDALATAPTRVPVVDALDACAAALSAQRIAD